MNKNTAFSVLGVAILSLALMTFVFPKLNTSDIFSEVITYNRIDYVPLLLDERVSASINNEREIIAETRELSPVTETLERPEVTVNTDVSDTPEERREEDEIGPGVSNTRDTDADADTQRERRSGRSSGSSNNSELRRARFADFSFYKFLNGEMATFSSTSGDSFPVFLSIAGQETVTNLDNTNNYTFSFEKIAATSTVEFKEITNDMDPNSYVFSDQLSCVQVECPSDINGDRVVDGGDLALVLNYWTYSDADPTPPMGDLNADGLVNGSDLGLVLSDWGVCQASYKLDGYSYGNTLQDASSSSVTTQHPVFEGNLIDTSVIVWNSICEFNPDDNDGGDDEEEGEDENENENNGSNGNGSSNGSSGGSGSRRNTGDVLGASTGDVLGESVCSTEYLSKYIKYGAENDPAEVMKLQIFLNKFQGANLPITGIYGPQTREAVNRFQLAHNTFVLAPWKDAGFDQNPNTPTGYVYQTTRRWINLLECPDLAPYTPIPTLVLDTR